MKRIILTCLSGLMCFTAQAQWAIDNQHSAVSFVSVKKEHIAEAHRFDTVSGQLSEGGEFNLAIDLASVNTGIGIRNERMREHLFKTENFPQAMLSAKVDIAALNKLAVGQSVNQQLSASLSLVGNTQQLPVSVMITKVNNSTLLVSSVKSVIVNAKVSGLVAGIDKLAQLAGLNSIGYSVPVSFTLRLTKT